MNLQTILFVCAALSGAVFTVPATAQEIEPPAVTVKTPVVFPEEKKPSIEWSSVEILRGADVKPHVIPAWFARRASPPLEQVPEIESFVYQPAPVASSIGRPQRMGPAHSCRRPNGTWVFCD